MGRALKVKTCKVCQSQFQPWSSMSSLNRFCSPLCGAKWAGMKRDEHRVKAARKEISERKKALKTKNDWVKEAQVQFNKYIRERDHDKPCMACGTTNESNGLTGSSWDAGHYRSRGSAPHLRFHTINVWKVCTRCNRELSGNIVEMRKGMVARLGEERVRRLDSDNRQRHYKISDIERIKSVFSRRARLHKRLRENPTRARV